MLPPREVKFSLIFFKSLSGLSTGVVGMIILLIFVLLGLGTVSGGSVIGPFLIFSAIIMGLVTALIANCLGVFLFGLLDRAKYPDVRNVVKHVISLNILIFIFLLPVYFFGVIGTANNVQTIFFIATLQLIVSALASMFTLELSASQSPRDNLIAIYGIVFSVLAAIVINLLVYSLFQSLSTPAELTVGGSGGKGPTAVLFAILPITWFLFGFFTTLVEMLYRWIYETWGIDILNR
ncbi:MAG: hypothetical protein ABIH35_04090 [Patescibacteria group bacterium]